MGDNRALVVADHFRHQAIQGAAWLTVQVANFLGIPAGQLAQVVIAEIQRLAGFGAHITRGLIARAAYSVYNRATTSRQKRIAAPLRKAAKAYMAYRRKRRPTYRRRRTFARGAQSWRRSARNRADRPGYSKWYQKAYQGRKRGVWTSVVRPGGHTRVGFGTPGHVRY